MYVWAGGKTRDTGVENGAHQKKTRKGGKWKIKQGKKKAKKKKTDRYQT
jgi:hypothetical protein